MHYLLTTTLLATALALPLAGTASAQRINEDVMSRCNQSVGQLKFEGWPADRNREMMMAACQNAGGTSRARSRSGRPRCVTVRRANVRADI